MENLWLGSGQPEHDWVIRVIHHLTAALACARHGPQARRTLNLWAPAALLQLDLIAKTRREAKGAFWKRKHQQKNSQEDRRKEREGTPALPYDSVVLKSDALGTSISRFQSWIMISGTCWTSNEVQNVIPNQLKWPTMKDNSKLFQQVMYVLVFQAKWPTCRNISILDKNHVLQPFETMFCP